MIEAAKAFLKPLLRSAFDSAKTATPLTAAGWVMVVILIASAPALWEAVKTFAARAGCVTALELPGGVKLSVSAQQVYQILAPINARFRKETAERIAELQPDEFHRLMRIGLLDADDRCEFESPQSFMRRDLATDYALEEKGLVKIGPDPGARADLTTGRKAVAGNAIRCYNLKLTDLGQDVRSALVLSFKDAFAGRATSDKPKDDAKMAAR